MAIRVEGVDRAKVGRRWVVELAKLAARALGRSKDDLSIVFLTSGRIKKFNAQYRKLDRPTDTLSFPSEMPSDLGDVFIAPSEAAKKAAVRGMGYRDYLALLIVHGVLHLGGYDHHTEKESAAMGKMEEKILKSC